MDMPKRLARYAKYTCLPTALAASLLIAGCGGGGGSDDGLEGRVLSGGEAVQQAAVSIVEKRTDSATASSVVARTTTATTGSWSVDADCSSNARQLAVAAGGITGSAAQANGATVLAAAVPACGGSQQITVNDTSTVAAASSFYHVLQFTGSNGTQVSLAHADKLAQAFQYYDGLVGANGQLSRRVSQDAQALALFTTLSRAVADCNLSGDPRSVACTWLLSGIGAKNGQPARNSLEAVANFVSRFAPPNGPDTETPPPSGGGDNGGGSGGGDNGGGSGGGGNGGGSGGGTTPVSLDTLVAGLTSLLNALAQTVDHPADSNDLRGALEGLTALVPQLGTEAGTTLGATLTELQVALASLSTTLDQLGKGQLTGPQLISRLTELVTELTGLGQRIGLLDYVLADLAPGATTATLSALKTAVTNLGNALTRQGGLVDTLEQILGSLQLANGNGALNGLVTATVGSIVQVVGGTLTGVLPTVLDTLDQVLLALLNGLQAGTGGGACPAGGLLDGLGCGIQGLLNELSKGRLLSGLGALLGLRG